MGRAVDSLTLVLNELLGMDPKVPSTQKRCWGKEKPGFSMEEKSALGDFPGFRSPQEWWGNIRPWRLRNLGAEEENSKFPVLLGGREFGPGHLQIPPKYKNRESKSILKYWGNTVIKTGGEKRRLGPAISHLPPGIRTEKSEKGGAGALALLEGYFFFRGKKRSFPSFLHPQPQLFPPFPAPFGTPRFPLLPCVGKLL